MKKKVLLAAVTSISLVSVVSLGILSSFANKKINLVGTADGGSYTMQFNNWQSKTIIYDQSSIGSGTATYVNDNDNAFDIEYYNIKRDDDNHWETIVGSGYVRNLTPICGITKIQIIGATVQWEIHYGASISQAEEQYVLSDDESIHNIDLSAYAPNYFMIKPHDVASNTNVAVTKMVIYYSCSPTYCEVNATSSNTTFGTVSGGGIYTIGDEVTLTATKASDYENKIYGVFKGWYDGETLLSTSTTYTFTIQSGIPSYNYEAKFVEADSEEFTTPTQLYYSTWDVYGTHYVPENYVSFLKSSDGKYFALTSYQDDTTLTPDVQPFEENKVFVSNGRGEYYAMIDMYLNKAATLEASYFTDSTGSTPVEVKRFGTDIEAIDFYLDLSSSNYLDATNISIYNGVLGKYDVSSGKYARFTVVGSNYNKQIKILIPDDQSTSTKMVVSKVVIHYRTSSVSV